MSKEIFFMEYGIARYAIKINKLTKFTFMCILSLLTCAKISSAAAAPVCSSIYSQAVQTHSSGGEISFDWNSQILKNPVVNLPVYRVNSYSWSVLQSCGTAPCGAAIQAMGELDITFLTTNSTTDNQVAYKSNMTLGSESSNNFRNITLNPEATLNFTKINADYKIKNINLGYAAVLNLPAGNYWVENFTASTASRINVVGDGTARLFVKNGLTLPWQSYANTQSNGAEQNASKLFIYTEGDFNLQTGAAASAVVYAKRYLNLSSQSQLYGAASFSYAYLGTQAQVSFQKDAVAFSEMGNVCSNSTSSSSSSSSSSSTDTCKAAFANGLQTFGEGASVNFQYNAQLHNASSTQLNTLQVLTNSGSNKPSCDTAQCSAKGTAITRFTTPAFKQSSSVTSVTVPWLANMTIGDSSNLAFNKISISSAATLTLTAQTSPYKIKELYIAYQGTLKLPAGDYWIETLTMDSDSRVEVIGTGTVRLYVKNAASIPWMATFNNNTADASKLILYHYNTFELQTGTTFYGLIYSESQVKLGYQAKLSGAISANKIFLDTDSHVTYKADAVALAKFGDICTTNQTQPDLVPPVLTVNAPVTTTEATAVTLTGTATDPVQDNSGITSVAAINQGQRLAAVLNGSNFTVNVPLVLGDNLIVVEASDFSGNITTKNFTIKRTSLPKFKNVTPADGQIFPVPNATITGEITTLWPSNNIQFKVNGNVQPLTFVSTGLYKFTLSNVALALGKNTFTLNVTTPDGSADTTLNLHYVKPDRDGDGHPDDEDAFPDNPNEWADLDKDGIGDNSDPDRDGDGFSNIIEQQRGTNPDDATDYPDTIAPTLQISTANNQALEAENINVTGTVSDPVQPHSGLTSVVVTTSTGQTIPAVINGNNFSAAVPLSLGATTITVKALDKSNNSTSKSILITRISVPHIVNVAPAEGSKLPTPSTAISGDIQTAWPLANIQFTINNVAHTLVANGPNAYKFNVANVNLNEGNNSFVLKLVTPDGNANLTLNISYVKPDRDNDGHPDDADAFPDDPNEWSDLDKDGIGDNSDTDRDGDGFDNTLEQQRGTDPNNAADYPDTVAPALQISTANNQVINAASITVAGTVTDPTQPHSGVGGIVISLNGQDFRPTLAGNNFSIVIPLQPGDNNLKIDAKDLSNNIASKNLLVKRVSLATFNNITPANGTNLAQQSTTISGEIHTAWPLANVQFTFNNTAQTLQPVSEGIYRFSVQNVHLHNGSNSFALSAITPDGKTDTALNLTYTNLDSDGDGYPDVDDKFPNDPNEHADMDNDGIGDNSDPDRDGDGISNDYETQAGSNPNDASSFPPDRDGDGIPDQFDDDRDGDGHSNAEDLFPDDPTEWADMDRDGIGDNSDPDRDGDGFSNDEETQANTDPSNASDYPDRVAPIVSIFNPSGEKVSGATLVLRGSASDPVQAHSGIASVKVVSDKYPQTTFSGVISGENFDAEIPLVLGANTFVITATDKAGNHSEITHTVQRISLPHFGSISPANGSVIQKDKVSLVGQILSDYPPEAVRFYINEWQVTPTGTGQNGIYSFDLPDIPLKLGQNSFTLRLVTTDGTEEKLWTLTRTAENENTIPAPQVSVIAPVSGTQLRDASFRIKGHVVSQIGTARVTMNGQVANITSSSGKDSYFDGIISFTENQNAVAVVIEAIDVLNKRTSITVNYQRDSAAPIINVENSISASPAINAVTQSSFTFNGTVEDSNLASVTVNDEPIQLQPDAIPGRYIFAIPVNLGVGAQKQFSFTAYDMSGNRTDRTYVFQSTARTAIAVLLPAEQSEFISKGSPINLQVAARLTDIRAEDIVVASIGNTQVTLTLAGTLASGDIALPAAAGDYTINYKVLDNAQQVVASTSRQVHVTSDDAIAVKLLRHSPELGAINIEPNQPLELYFNKAIDPAKVVITARETLHGNTYINRDEAGADFLNAKGHQLEEVHRDNETVTGGISMLPGNQSLAFYTTREFGYNADVNVEIKYDNKELAHFNFKVRPLPTFITGGVVDQFGQPLAGVKINLSAANRTTVTNKDGAFAFGFQEQAGQEIPAGRYSLTINPDFALPGYGTQVRTITLQAGRKNEIGMVNLPELSPDLPFQLINSGDAAVSLAGNDLRLDLSSAQLLFNNGRTSGAVQTQFMPYTQLGATVNPGARPQWMFALQPRGLVVEGSVGIDIKMPALRGAYDYLPEDMVYVILLGYNAEHAAIEPIGVGKIQNYRVTSVGKLKLTSLDYVGYALVKADHQALLKDVADGKLTMQQLISNLQQ